MNYGVFEDDGWQMLLPLTWLRPAWELCCGRDRLLDKLVAARDGRLARVWARPELAELTTTRLILHPPDDGAPWCLLNGRLLLTGPLPTPPVGTAWVQAGQVVAATVSAAEAAALTADTFLDPLRRRDWLERLTPTPPPGELRLLNYPWELALANAAELRRQLTAGGVLAGKVYPGCHLLNPSAIHVAAGAKIMPGVVLDAEEGPIHIDAGAVIQPNAYIEGPCYVGPGSIVRPTAVIRAGTTIGPVCRVGGEVEGSILHGYCNKQHDGFLGHSYIGPWVNLGAGTINSDLKNTYGTIRVSLNGTPVETGQRFVGATIGDHAKTGIGTCLPTGAIIGVAANVFTRAPLPKFVPSFAWLTDDGLAAYRPDKAVETARTVMGRRKVTLSPAEAALLAAVATRARTIESAGWKNGSDGATKRRSDEGL